MNYFRYFVLKGFVSYKPFVDSIPTDLSTDDVEGVIHSTIKLKEEELKKYLLFLKSSDEFCKEYEITWNRGTILKGSGIIHSSYDNFSSLKILEELDVFFFSIDQLKIFTDHCAKGFKEMKDCFNDLVENDGRLFIINMKEFKEPAEKKNIDSNNPTISNIPKAKNISSIAKRQRLRFYGKMMK